MYLETKELITVSPTRVGKYHELAEAIRRGCKIRPRQCKWTARKPDEGCVLMAMAIGSGIPLPRYLFGEGTPYDALRKRFPVISVEFQMELSSRNDRGWSREQIADWLDTL